MERAGADEGSVAKQNIHLSLAFVWDPVRDMMRRAGVEVKVGPKNMHESVGDASVAFRARLEQ